MNKKRKSRKGSKNKPVSNWAKFIADYIHAVNELRERVLLRNSSKETVDTIDHMERFISRMLFERATAADGSLSEIDRLLQQRKKKVFNNLVVDAYINLLVSGIQSPTHDEIVDAYCKKTGKTWTESIASQVRRAVTREKIPIKRLKKPKNAAVELKKLIAYVAEFQRRLKNTK